MLHPTLGLECCAFVYNYVNGAVYDVYFIKKEKIRLVKVLGFNM